MIALASELRAWARREPLLAGLFAVAAIATAAPIWVGRYLPLLDYPNHVAMVFVWRHLHDPAWNFERWYQINLPPVPYWAQYVSVYGLATIVGDEIAMKIFTTLAVLLPPASLAVYARRVGRDPRLALLMFPLGWNLVMAHGFISYLAGLPVFFFALTALDAHAEKPSWKWATVAALLGASLYFFHLLPWAMFLIVGGLAALLAIPPGQRRVWRLLVSVIPTVPAAAIGGAAYLAAKTMKGNTARHLGGLSGWEGAHNDLAGNLAHFPLWTIDYLPTPTDDVLMLVLLVVWLFLLASRPLTVAADAGETSPPEARGLRAWRHEISTVLMTAAYFILPRSLMKPFYWYSVNRRLSMVVLSLLFLMVRGPIGRRGPRRVLLHVAGVVAILIGAGVTASFHRFNVRMRDFDEVMESVPRHKQVLPLMITLRDPESNISVFNQWGTWVQLRQGGYMPFNLPLEFPIQYRQQLPAPLYDQPRTFRFHDHGEAWDYFLVYGDAFDPFVGAHDRVRLVKRVRQWAMWERLPRPPAVPKTK